MNRMVDEYYLKPPSKQLFYNIMAFLLSILALNSGFWQFYKMPDHIFYRFQRLVVLYAFPVGFVSEIMYLVMNYSQHDLNTLAMIYTVLPVSFVVMVKIAVTQTPSYKRAMLQFIDQIHVFNYYRNNRQPYVREILIKAEIYKRWSIYVLSFLCFFCNATFMILPIIHSFQNNESIYNVTSRLEIMLHFWLPFDYEFNFFYWAIMQVLVAYCVIMGISIIVIFDVLNLAFLYHLIGHIKILKHILKNEFNGNMTQGGTKRKLIEVSQYYTFIKKYLIMLNNMMIVCNKAKSFYRPLQILVSTTYIKIFKVVEDAFGLNIVGIYLHNLIGGGILIYEFMGAGSDTGALISYGLMIPIYLGELIIISLVLENIRIQSVEIPNLVYNLRWEKMTIPNQKLVLMILFQVQPVLEFKAAFNVKTGVEPAINILKTTFSYYLMIKARV